MKMYEISGFNKFGHKITCTIYARDMEEAEAIWRTKLRLSESIYDTEQRYEKSELYDWLNERDDEFDKEIERKSRQNDLYWALMNNKEPRLRWYHYAGVLLLFVLFMLAGMGDVIQ